MFTGEYRHTVDDKGRLAIPARFRAQLEGGAVLSRWIDGCLAKKPMGRAFGRPGAGTAPPSNGRRPCAKEDTLHVTTSAGKRLAALAALVAIATAACTGGGATPSPAGSGTPAASGPAASTPAASSAPLSGSVNIDGSSTVYPITEAVAEEFQKANGGVKVTVAFAGTGGGFKKFCNGETDMNDASRPIKADDAGEGVACKAKSIEWLELGIATDALSVVVSKSNTFVTCLTTAQLKTMWDQGSTAKSWKPSA